jgi:ABC-type dipeptide/oligopeptide/nickel transport system permease component
VTGYLARRLLETAPVLLLSSVLIFLLLRALPGDPALILAGPDATPEVVSAVRRSMGLDRPWPVQYVLWVGRVVRGDLGVSFATRYPIADLLAATFPATVELVSAALLLGLALSVPIGILSALRERTALDYGSAVFNTLSLSVPDFWLGLLLMMAFALGLGWLPAGGRPLGAASLLDVGRFVLLPALTLALPVAAVQTRFIRATLLEVLGEDYLRTARAKGVREALVVARHALPNALVPVMTVVGLQFGRLLGGVVIIETVFSWPGMGRLVVQSLANRDYLVVQACLLLLVVTFAVVNLVTDLAYGLLDPRIRLGAGRR